jgi:hypothetical protein
VPLFCFGRELQVKIVNYHRLIWLLFCLVAGAVFLTYACASLAAGRGEFVLPLDDVYIHFQYARQMANGQPYIYNPGQPPTSGATSFLYPYVLAVGYLLGFQGLNLSLWAMGIGALALLGSLWLVYRLVKTYSAPDWLAAAAALIFGLTGSVSWHYMSGMETGLMLVFTLATLYAVVTQRRRWFVVSASLLALTRPEGGVLAIIAAAAMIVPAWRTVPLRHLLPLLIPVLAVFVQPLVNLLVTGSAVATGNSVKSVFGTVPFYWDVVIGRILENFARMWAEFVTGVSPREGLYVPYLVGPLALVFVIGGLFSRRCRLVNAMLLLWLLAGTASIATLDTAFWHFKRYQMPLIALLFPAAGWAMTEIQRNPLAGRLRTGAKAQRINWTRYGIYALMGAGLVVALTTGAAFLHHFALNVTYVYLQPLQMARWLQANTPEDALIAVHDVGMMRYIGERTTLDMVGLTTPGAAAYWRNGPGSIAEFLIQERPDYIASYGRGHGFGLELIANTSIYGDPLAEFPVDLDPHYNVALAADYQGIYQPEWSYIVPDFADTFPEAALINVANVASETLFDYRWSNRMRLRGFPTDLIEIPRPLCSRTPCADVLAGRVIDGSEMFTLKTVVDGAGVLVATVLHPRYRGTLDLYVNDEFVDRNWIPEMPGQILFAPTYIPSSYITGDEIYVRIEPNVPDGYYMPLLHIVRQTELYEPENVPESLAIYQNGAFELSLVSHTVEESGLILDLQWYSRGNTEGDYRFFAHLYDDATQPPIAQTDNYPSLGTAPPGNWLPGPIPDRVVVNLTDVPPGTYQLAIGFYDPYTGERLMPESEVYEVSPDGRLWLGEVEVPGRED